MAHAEPIRVVAPFHTPIANVDAVDFRPALKFVRAATRLGRIVGRDRGSSFYVRLPMRHA